jgi:FkbM family methyltransferase
VEPIAMDELSLRLSDGTTIVVPASLNSITTYVLLEQEAWFEKEMAFLARWLRPGMTAIDIGANLGVYSLPMARLVAPDGGVFSYEPASEPRRLLERSRILNQAANLHVLAAALSDRPREGQLVLGASSELNSLGGSGSSGTAPSERVQITCLDLEEGARAWRSIDFVKASGRGAGAGA